MFMVNQSPWRLTVEIDSAYVMLPSLSVVIGSQENSGRQCDRSAHKRLPVIRSDEQIRTQAIFFMNIFSFPWRFFPLSSTSPTSCDFALLLVFRLNYFLFCLPGIININSSPGIANL